jgi:hypothetical protein
MDPDLWWQRFRRDREARNWSQNTTAKQLIAHSEHYSEFDEESVVRSIKRWEAGQLKTVPSVEYQSAIARMFGSVRSAYFPTEDSGAEPTRLSDDETLELVSRLRSSSVDDATLELARITVDRLCTDYATVPGPIVLGEAQQWLREISGLTKKSMSLRQHQEIYDLGAWLSLLVACLHYDAGDERGADAARRAAVMLGAESGQTEVLGWGAEIKAWMALTQGNYHGVLSATKEGLAATRTHAVAVQLHAQTAKAWARLGNRTRVEVALDQGRELLDSLPYPDNPRNHFQVDPAKFDFYAMDCYRNVGEDRLAGALAATVQQMSTTPSGTVVAPMRLAEAELTQAVIYARAGELNQALTTANEAVAIGRQSLPSLLLVAREVSDEITRLHPGSQQAAAFAHHLSELESVP